MLCTAVKNCCKSWALLLCSATRIERGAQGFDPLTIGNVVVAGVEAGHLALDIRGALETATWIRVPSFFLRLSLECNALAFGDRFA